MTSCYMQRDVGPSSNFYVVWILIPLNSHSLPILKYLLLLRSLGMSPGRGLYLCMLSCYQRLFGYSLCISEMGSARNNIFGDRSSSKHCTTLTSAAFAFFSLILPSPSCVSVSLFVAACSMWSLILFVLTRTACMLPMTFSAAFANGKSTPSTSSGEIQLFTAPRPAS